MAKVTLIFNNDKKTDLQNCRTISVLPYFTKNKILYNKRLGFQNSHSNEHATTELLDKLLSHSEKNKYTNLKKIQKQIQNCCHKDIVY